MNRKDKLENLKNKLRDDYIFNFREELEDFLQEEDDQHTKELQEAISDKLNGIQFHFTDFDSFLSDYQKRNQSDPAVYSSLRSEIYGNET